MLLAIPIRYYYPMPGLPDFNFFHTAEIPIFLWWCFKGIKNYKISFMDFLVFCYLAISILSEFSTMGFKDGINIIIDRVVQVGIPYLLMKHFFSQTEMRIPILKIMVIIGAILALLSPPEFKFDIVITDPLRWVWPDYFGWAGRARYGAVRVAATYAHPILAGLMWSFFSMFALWLYKQNVWKKKWIGIAAIILNMGGVLMSISRGPMLGLLVGFVLIYIGWSKKRTTAIMIVFAISIVIIPPAFIKFISYVSVDRSSATSKTQENAAYRKELLDNYIEEIKIKPLLGYGRNGIPVVKGQTSIDNQFIYIALLHGVPTLICFILITIFVAIKLLRFAWTNPPDSAYGQLSWLIIGCACSWFVTLATVWMGAQLEQMVFMISAMACVIGKEVYVEQTNQFKVSFNENEYWSFRRVL